MYVISILLGIIQFSLIGYILIQEAEKKSPAVFLWATLFIMFAFPHLLTTFIQDLNYSESVIIQASLFVCGFCLIYILFRSKRTVSYVNLVDNDHFQIEPTGIEKSLLEHLCFIIFLVSLVGYVIFIIRAQGGIFNTSWASARSVETSYVSFSGLADRLIFTFSGLCLFYFLTQRKGKSIVIILLFIGLVLVTRNRVQVIPVLVFFVSLYLIKIQKIKIKHIIAGILLAAIIVYVIYALRAFRYLGTISDAVSNFSWKYINTTVRGFLNSRDGELGLRQYFYYFIQHNNNFEGFNRGYTYLRMLLVYIPSRWSLGLKPQSFDLYMGQAIGMVSGGSMHPTLFGDCFGNMWWFGVLLGGLWAVLANQADRIIDRQKENFFKIMFFFLASYSFVVIGRGSVYNGFEVFAWGGLILAIIRVFTPKITRVRIICRT